MNDKVKFILTLVTVILASACSILNMIGGNYFPAVIWGIVAVLNIISLVLTVKHRK